VVQAEGDPETLPLTLALPLFEIVAQLLADGEGVGEALLVVVTEIEEDSVVQVESVYDALAHAEGDPEALPLTRALPLVEAEPQPLPDAVRCGDMLLVPDSALDGVAVGHCAAEAECDEVLLVLAQEEFVTLALLLRLAEADSEGERGAEAVPRPEGTPLLLGDGHGKGEAVGKNEALPRPDIEPQPLGEGESLLRPDVEPRPLKEGDCESEGEAVADGVPQSEGAPLLLALPPLLVALPPPLALALAVQ
jgi:hypothetical protein